MSSLHGASMFPYLCWFPLGTLVSSHTKDMYVRFSKLLPLPLAKATALWLPTKSS
uniref:Uncharacterized protein n=1 Tax=Anguilla anguilla TaxID=7936 RepID=A0A0E9UY70_ANGAN